MYELPNMTQEDIKILNNWISGTEIENGNKIYQKKKSSDPNGPIAEFYKKRRKDSMKILLKFFDEMEREAFMSNSFVEASITLMWNPRKD